MYIIKNNKLESTDNIDLFFNEINVGQHIAKYGYFESDLINWLKLTYKNNDKIFLDLGAHIGSYSIELAENFHSVHSFEPNPTVYNHLCANVALKRLSNRVFPHRVALSDNKSKQPYYERSKDGGGNGIEVVRENDKHSFFVESKCLDDYSFDKEIGLIKIDIEGHEYKAILGAYETLKNSYFPPIIFESWAQNTHPEYSQEILLEIRDKTFDVLKDYGYTVKSISGYNEMFIAVQEREKSQEDIIVEGLLTDKLDVWLNSPGGTRSNYIADVLEKSNLRVRNESWYKYGCHWTSPLFEREFKTTRLFCYTSDIGLALTSQLNANTIDKLNFADFYNEPWDLYRWIQNIKKQVINWSDPGVFFLNTDYLNDKDIQSEFKTLTGDSLDISDFRLDRKSKKLHPALIQYMDEINEINELLAKLPNAGFGGEVDEG